MARVRSPNRDKAKRMYFDAKGDIKLVDIASKLNIKDSQVRKWKSQDKWDEELKGTLPKDKRNVTNKKSNKSTPIKEPIAEEVKEVLRNTNLTDKQRLFCIYYIKCFNATKSYLKAYGCSYETAMVEGCNSLKNPKIKAEIQKLKQNKLNRALLSEDDIFQKYIDIAFADISDYMSFGKRHVKCWTKDKDGNDIPVIDLNTGEQKVISYNVVDLKESDNVDTTLISEVSEGKDGVKVKLQDKMKALQWLSEHLDLLTKLQADKLELEKEKLEIAKIKSGAYEEDEEVEDDGFIDALHGAAKGVWDNEEDS
ncbi:MAG TPA: phage portal protein [Clostridium sp.]|nr:phage portal protein [Clostridium sp.]